MCDSAFQQGWDKTHCLKYLKEYDEIYFYGDKTMPVRLSPALRCFDSLPLSASGSSHPRGCVWAQGR
jgi:hypothetical protein